MSGSSTRSVTGFKGLSPARVKELAPVWLTACSYTQGRVQVVRGGALVFGSGAGGRRCIGMGLDGEEQ